MVTSFVGILVPSPGTGPKQVLQIPEGKAEGIDKTVLNPPQPAGCVKYYSPVA